MDGQLMQQQPPPIAGAKLVAGIFFALLGLLMTLENLDVYGAHRALRYWPVVLIVIGLIRLTDRSDRLMAWISLAAGVLLLLLHTRWIRFSIFDLWPLMLILAGVLVVLHAFGWRPSQTLDPSRPNLWAILSTRKVASEAQDYAGGRIVTFMGECQLDLTAADLGEGPAVVEIVAVWGHVLIRVPIGWEVAGGVTPIMGGVEIKTKGARGGRQLIVRGLVLMGGVEVKSEPGRTA